MKNFRTVLFVLGIILLTSCTFSLAEDVTPPPGYVPPTPAPTLGPLFPAQAPSVDAGAAIFVEKCAPCHGHTGMGDGTDGKQLPVTVPALALPENGRKSTPAQWFRTVTQGNLERFMPPFASLDDQQRWDVISYALTLHYTQDLIDQGKSLYEANCTTCHASGFTQEQMAGKSEDAIAMYMTKGHDKFPAAKLSEDEAYAVAAFMRISSFAAPQAAATVAPVTATAAASEAGTPNATDQASITQEAAIVSAPGFGVVRGSIDNQTGEALPADLQVTLRAYEHGSDPNTGPAEIFNQAAVIQPDGTYSFENIEIPANRIFLSEVVLNGLTLKSQYAVVKAGDTGVSIEPIVLYPMTSDASAISLSDVTMFFDFGADGKVQMFAVYSMLNNSDKTILIKMGQGQEVPFLKFPTGAEGLGYEATQDSATFLPTSDGFGMPPSDKTYGLIAFANLPADKKVEQSFVLPVANVTVLLPDGVTTESTQLTDNGVIDMQGTKFHGYNASNFKAGDVLSFTLTGTPTLATNTTETGGLNQNLLIGIGALGLVLIVSGGWLYLRDRKRAQDEEQNGDGFDDPDDMMDAIIALDDLHREGKISDEAYKERRTELKDSLKRLS